MKKTSLIRTTAALLGMAVGGMLYGQSVDAPKTPSFYATGDSIFNVEYIKPLPRDKDTDIYSLISGGHVTDLTVLDPITVLTGKLNYLKNDQRAKDFYNSNKNPATHTVAEESRLKEIAICEQLLAQVSSEKRTPEYYKSLENLSRDVTMANHVLTAKEMEGIAGGFTYAFDMKGYSIYMNGNKIYTENYDVPMLVTFPVAESKPTVQEVESIQAKPAQPKQPLPLPQAPVGTPAPSQSPIPKPDQASETKKSDSEIYFDFVNSPELIGGKVGLTGKVFDFGTSGVEARMGIALSGAYGYPQVVDSTQTSPSSTGRYFEGNITNEDLLKAGLEVDFAVGDKNGNFYFGIGPNIWVYDQKTLEQLLDSSNNVIKSNTNEKLQSSFGMDANLGFQLYWFRFSIGWDSMKQFYGESGITIPY